MVPAEAAFLSTGFCRKESYRRRLSGDDPPRQDEQRVPLLPFRGEVGGCRIGAEDRAEEAGAGLGREEDPGAADIAALFRGQERCLTGDPLIERAEGATEGSSTPGSISRGPPLMPGSRTRRPPTPPAPRPGPAPLRRFPSAPAGMRSAASPRGDGERRGIRADQPRVGQAGEEGKILRRIEGDRQQVGRVQEFGDGRSRETADGLPAGGGFPEGHDAGGIGSDTRREPDPLQDGPPANRHPSTPRRGSPRG